MKLTSVSLATLVSFLCSSADALFRAANPLDLSLYSNSPLKDALKADVQTETVETIRGIFKEVEHRLATIGDIRVTDTTQLDELGRALLYLSNKFDKVPAEESAESVEARRQAYDFVQRGIDAMEKYFIYHKYGENDIPAELMLEHYCLFLTKTKDCIPVSSKDSKEIHFRKPTSEELKELESAIGNFLSHNPHPGMIVYNAISQLAKHDTSYSIVAGGFLQLHKHFPVIYGKLLSVIGSQNVDELTDLIQPIDAAEIFGFSKALNSIAFLIDISLPEGGLKQSMKKPVLDKAKSYADSVREHFMTFWRFSDESMSWMERGFQKIKNIISYPLYWTGSNASTFAVNSVSLNLNGATPNWPPLKYLAPYFENVMDKDEVLKRKINAGRKYFKEKDPKIYVLMEKVINRTNFIAELDVDDTADRTPVRPPSSAESGSDSGKPSGPITIPDRKQPDEDNGNKPYISFRPLPSTGSSSTVKEEKPVEKTTTASRIPVEVKKEEKKQAVSSGKGMSRGMKIGLGVGITASVVVLAAVAYYFLA